MYSFVIAILMLVVLMFNHWGHDLQGQYQQLMHSPPRDVFRPSLARHKCSVRFCLSNQLLFHPLDVLIHTSRHFYHLPLVHTVHLTARHSACSLVFLVLVRIVFSRLAQRNTFNNYFAEPTVVGDQYNSPFKATKSYGQGLDCGEIEVGRDLIKKARQCMDEANPVVGN